ncbi:hypothetical protein OAS92_03985 [Candidatus Pelagibacter sp.]|jgi:outer membrane protein assembly factor BamE (lipoprotein component of BamABCDE complex)|nr:hypothetical protein [Candidatus Pelagibacter sp.]
MKFLKFIFVFIFISNCTLNKVVKNHGIHNLEKKGNKLELLKTNSNEVISQLGYPSTKSSFEEDIWIYLERKITSSEFRSLGKKKLLLNDVLVLEFNSQGMLIKKKFLSSKDMNDIKIVEGDTKVLNRKSSFINSFLRSLKQKINDPLDNKKAK